MPAPRRRTKPSDDQWDLFALLDEQQAANPTFDTPGRQDAKPLRSTAIGAESPARDGGLFAAHGGGLFADDTTSPDKPAIETSGIATTTEATASKPSGPVAANLAAPQPVPIPASESEPAGKAAPLAAYFTGAANVTPPTDRQQQAADNIAALTVLRTIEAAGRPATAAEQQTLARWRGWGGLPHIFDAPADNTDANYWATQLAARSKPLVASLRRLADPRTADAVESAIAGAVTATVSGDAAAQLLRQAARNLPTRDADSPGERVLADIRSELRAAATTAEWAPRRTELNALTTEQQRAAAARSSLTAYYTDPAVVTEIWSALKGLGFVGGSVLEPGAGVGTFIGQAPTTARMVGVELDPTTSAIARALYPSAEIVTGGFEGPGWNEGAFTAAVGNVPFGNFKLYDPAHNARGFTIHNHFLHKAVQLTAPGGIVAVITSAYTLDSKNPAARRALHRNADLVGAIRLPSGAFDGSGTSVVTDLVILRRRMNGEVPHPISMWEDTVDVGTPAGPVAINRYFAEHRDHVLGTLTAGTSPWGEHVATTIDGPDRSEIGAALREQLAAIVARAQSNGLTFGIDPDATLPAPHDDQLGSWDQVRKPGSIRVTANGGFERLDPTSRTWQPHRVARTHTAEARTLLELRDAVSELLAAQRGGTDDDRQAARAHATAIYERYVAAYGPVNRYSETTRSSWVLARNLDEADIDPDWPARQRGADKGRPELDEDGEPVMQVRRETTTRTRPPGVEALRSDPGFAAVLAVEDFDDDTQTATPAAILTRDVITPPQSPQQVESAADALAVVLDRTGRVDLDAIAGLIVSRPSRDETRAMLGDLVFDDPDERGNLVPAVTYLSGHVRSKLEAARAAAAVDPVTYGRNVAALEAVQPSPLGPADIEVRPGVTWIAGGDYADFIADALDSHGATVTWDQLDGSWQVDVPHKGSDAIRHTYGTDAIDAIDLLGHLMNNAPTTVTKTVTDFEGRERQVPDPDATELANAKKSALADRFGRWVWADEARASRLADVYNDRFNSHVAPHYDGSQLTFPGIGTQYSPRRTQAAAVARIIDQPTVLLDHVVGAGKTGTMVCAAMELRRLGLARQPWIVVPNHLVEQVAREAKQWYPDSQVLAGAPGLDAAGRRELVAMTATGDYDIVVIPESTFTGIPVSAQTQADFIADQLAELEKAIGERKDTDGGGRGSASRRLEMEKQNLETKLKALRGDGKAGRDTGLTFESTGCDYLLIDEAQHYKNRMVISHTRDLARGNDSQRALDLTLKLRVLREDRTDEGRPERIATFATGTPIANSPREMWVMLNYLRPDLLAAAGVDTFDAWAQNHLRPQTRLEMKPTGAGFQPKTRVTGFVNVPEMSRMWRQMADLVTRDDLPVKLPSMAGGTRQTTVIPRSPEQADYAAALEARVEAIKAHAVEPDQDNMLLVSSNGRAAALDQRLVGLPPAGDGGKATAIARGVMRIHHQHEGGQYLAADGTVSPMRGGFQIVFLDQSTPKPGQWNLYRQIKDELVEAGVPAEQVRFIHEAPPGPARVELFQSCRDGRVAVLIGSTAKLGTGANIQDRLTAIHHADVPWRPDFLEQREGRAIRQGNQNDEVEICTYVAENTFDAYSWNLIAVKAKFIGQIKNGTTTRHVEVDDSDQDNFELIAAVSSGDPRVLERHQLGIDLAALERLDRAWSAEQRGISAQVRDLARTIDGLPGAIEAAAALAARVTTTSGDAFHATLLGASYTERADAGRALHHHLAALYNSTGKVIAHAADQEIGRLGGLTLHLAAQPGTARVAITVVEAAAVADQLDTGMTIDPDELRTGGNGALGLGLIRRIENLVASIPAQAAGLALRQAGYEKRLGELKAMAGQSFEHAARLDELRSRVRALDADLAKPAEVIALDPPAPSWMSQIPEAERGQMVWGPRLHRVNPDGAIRVGELREGDILAAIKEDTGVRLITEVGGYGATSTITMRDLATGSESEQRKRDTTTVGVVARRLDNLHPLEATIAASDAGDEIVRIDEIAAGDCVTVYAAAIDADGTLDSAAFTATAIRLASISDEPEPVRGKRFRYRPPSYMVATAVDGSRYAIANGPAAARAIKHPVSPGERPEPTSDDSGRVASSTTTSRAVAPDPLGRATTAGAAGPTIRHSDAGTIVTGVDLSDVALCDALKANNFTWSAAQGVWSLPDDWLTSTRALAVSRLSRRMADLGHELPIKNDTAAPPGNSQGDQGPGFGPAPFMGVPPDCGVGVSDQPPAVRL